MLEILDDLPWAISSLIVVFAFVVVSILGLLITRRFVNQKNLRAHHDIAGYTFGIIGVIYAVLLGFIVVQVNDRFHSADANTMEETAIMMNLFRDVAPFSKEERLKVRTLIKDYAKAVLDSEWSSLALEEESEKARDIFYQLWKTYADLKPQTDQQKIWYQESISKLNDLSILRTKRIFNSTHALGPMMWTLLIIGAFITIVFMYFFYADHIVLQCVMISFLAGTIAFMLFLIMSLEGIYRGDISVKPTEIEKAIIRFEATMDGKTE